MDFQFYPQTTERGPIHRRIRDPAALNRSRPRKRLSTSSESLSSATGSSKPASSHHNESIRSTSEPTSFGPPRLRKDHDAQVQRAMNNMIQAFATQMQDAHTNDEELPPDKGEKPIRNIHLSEQVIEQLITSFAAQMGDEVDEET